jgi:hypothetical protein
MARIKGATKLFEPPAKGRGPDVIPDRIRARELLEHTGLSIETLAHNSELDAKTIGNIISLNSGNKDKRVEWGSVVRFADHVATDPERILLGARALSYSDHPTNARSTFSWQKYCNTEVVWVPDHSLRWLFVTLDFLSRPERGLQVVDPVNIAFQSVSVDLGFEGCKPLRRIPHVLSKQGEHEVDSTPGSVVHIEASPYLEETVRLRFDLEAGHQVPSSVSLEVAGKLLCFQSSSFNRTKELSGPQLLSIGTYLEENATASIRRYIIQGENDEIA